MDRVTDCLDRAAARDLDLLCVSEYGIPTLVLMENAGRGLALHAVEHMPVSSVNQAIVVCGPGNNGGDGFVAARFLMNWGIDVCIASMRPVEELGGDAAIAANIARAMSIPMIFGNPDGGEGVLRGRDTHTLVIDSLFGTGLNRPVEGDALRWIGWINSARSRQRAVVVSADIPSGLDCDTGVPLGDAVRADLTVTFAARKPAFSIASAIEYFGDVRVAEIGAPVELIERLAGEARSRTRS